MRYKFYKTLVLESKTLKSFKNNKTVRIHKD